MPTGYTAGVRDGTITDFAEYAMNCARAFGALIEMRDDPSDAEIPKKLEPSTYSNERLKEAEEEFRRIGRMSNADAEEEAEKAYNEKLAHRARMESEQRKIRERYDAMLSKARAFRSPSSDHDGYAKFLVSQLTDSIEWDCHDSSDAMPVKETGLEWRIRRNAEVDHDVGYHRKEYSEEVERTNGRNEWLAKLRAELTKGETNDAE